MRKTAKEDAINVLRSELTSGSKTKQHLLAKVLPEGLSEASLYRAANELGVVFQCHGFPAQGTWSLREDKSQAILQPKQSGGANRHPPPDDGVSICMRRLPHQRGITREEQMSKSTKKASKREYTRAQYNHAVRDFCTNKTWEWLMDYPDGVELLMDSVLKEAGDHGVQLPDGREDWLRKLGEFLNRGDVGIFDERIDVSLCEYTLEHVLWEVAAWADWRRVLDWLADSDRLDEWVPAAHVSHTESGKRCMRLGDKSGRTTRGGLEKRPKRKAA